MVARKLTPLSSKSTPLLAVGRHLYVTTAAVRPFTSQYRPLDAPLSPQFANYFMVAYVEQQEAHHIEATTGQILGNEA